MSEQASIYQLLPAVMQDIGAVGKGQYNEHQRYNFRGIDAALNHVAPILARHGVCVSAQTHRPNVEHWAETTQKGERTVFHCTLELEVTFWAPDGSHIVNRMFGEALDYNGDKAANKAMAAAMKYALFFGLVIPVDAESIHDSDRDPQQPERPIQGGRRSHTRQQQQSRPAPAEQIKAPPPAEPLRTTLVEVFGKPPVKELGPVVTHLTEGLHSIADVGDPAVALAVHEALLLRHSQKQTWQQIHAEATRA